LGWLDDCNTSRIMSASAPKQSLPIAPEPWIASNPSMRGACQACIAISCLRLHHLMLIIPAQYHTYK
jgi:hypothetical protein